MGNMRLGVRTMRGYGSAFRGDQSGTRRFRHVDAVFEGINFFIQTPEDAAKTLNGSNLKDISITPLAHGATKRTGKRPGLACCKAPAGNLRLRSPEISPMRPLAGWPPSPGIDRGLDRYISRVSGHRDTTAGRVER